MRSASLLSLLALALVGAACGGGSSPSPAGGQAAEEAQPDNRLDIPQTGWKTDFSKHSVPLSAFLSGGPGKDGIPALDDPKFISVGEADEFLDGREPVIRLELGGEARGYPIQIMMWHEIVNDEVAGLPVAVTFCPLCNTALAFDRRVDGRVLDFGTTGNLRMNDLVMYDRQTESWWQQFGGEAIVGELTGEELTPVPVEIVSWEEFARENANGGVLSRDTGFERPYGQNPYTGYDDVDSPPFAPTRSDDRLAPKERVVFLEIGGEAIAVPFTDLREEKEITVEVGGEELFIVFVPGVASPFEGGAAGRHVGSARVRTGSGELVPFDTPFWFAVAAFRPDIEIVRD
jgi:hypothetical protein